MAAPGHTAAADRRLYGNRPVAWARDRACASPHRYGCALGEQLGAARRELHIRPGLMQPESAALDRQASCRRRIRPASRAPGTGKAR